MSTPQANDLLVDGFITHTFGPQDAYTFFSVSLRTGDFMQYYGISYSKGVWYIVQNTHHIPPPMRGAPIPNPPLPLDFNVRETEGTIVRQRRWTPMDDVDHRRHVEDATLQPPVFFVNRQSGGVGFWLPDILRGRDHDLLNGLLNGGGAAPLGGKTTTHVRINWPGYADWKRQIPARDETHERNPITLARFMKHVGTSVDKFINRMANEQVTDPRWRIGTHGITQDHVKIIGAVHVSAGSWMPILQLTVYLF